MNVVMVGDVIRGYCSGIFGDAWGQLRVEAVGADWVVVRDSDGKTWLASGPDIHNILYPETDRSHFN